MVLHRLEEIIILGLVVTVVILAYRLYMTKSYYKYDKDRLNRVEEDFEKNRTASSQELEKLQKIAFFLRKNLQNKNFALPLHSQYSNGGFI